MSAPVLSILEQKASISGKKKKRKTIKNVLSIPNCLKTECHFIQISCVKTLTKILERLLPTARLTTEKTIKSNKNSNETTNETQLKTEAKNRRNQLSLGVNALNRNIKNDLIATALLADDIQPKFLIHHLNLLCEHKKIPFLHMPGLREITNNCLGFPCIAVGFKKNFCDFSEAIEEIISISQTNKISTIKAAEETESDEEDIDEIAGDKMSDQKAGDEIDKNKGNDEVPFIHLYRTSTKERIFVPEQGHYYQTQKEGTDFISVKKSDTNTKCENDQCQLLLPLRVRKPVKKLKKLKNFENSEIDDNEDLEIPKKKLKKDWVIDKKGTKQNIKYYTANLMKFPSNSDRMKKNK